MPANVSLNARAIVTAGFANEVETDDPEPSAALAPCLTMFVARLHSPCREAITLVELKGMTMRAAADLVGMSVSGMNSRVQRGRAQLRCMLETCCETAVDARGGVTDFTPRPTTWCAAGPRSCSLEPAGVTDDDEPS